MAVASMAIAVARALGGLVLLAGPTVAAEKQELTPAAFVGTFVNTTKIVCESGEGTDETGKAYLEICMDSGWEMTYDVEKVLEGNLTAGSQVEFEAWDHYGFPSFARERRALIYLGKNGDSYYHLKYQWDPAYRTVDGDYADCGCAHTKTSDDGERASHFDPECRSVAFAPPVKVDLTHVSKYERDTIRASQDYQVNGDIATCVRGVHVEDIYKERRPDLIRQLNEDD